MQIVLVDPSRTVLRCMTRTLEACDHSVRAFLDGAEALEHLRVNKDVQTLITGTEPYSIRGIDVCQKARVQAALHPLYIILMSTIGDRARIKALDSGADDVIGKPPDPDDLYARLRAAERMVTMQRELMRLATTDPLTGLANRRAFFEGAAPVCDRAEAGGRLSALLLDIDHFKLVNDSYGHGVGDEAIRGTAKAIAVAGGLAGRLGGEEFATLLEGRNLSEALEVAEEMRKRIAELRFETERGPLSLTCSFGVSEWQPGDTIDGMLRRADMALYSAKTRGRDRVVAAAGDVLEAKYDQVSSVVRSR